MKIGIPRALLFYHFYPLWKTFFENLGFQVILSPETNITGGFISFPFPTLDK
jgi:predicted nucleotide-binding protein (sugar kinase/HSP70/actin superfamily)